MDNTGTHIRLHLGWTGRSGELYHIKEGLWNLWLKGKKDRGHVCLRSSCAILFRGIEYVVPVPQERYPSYRGCLYLRAPQRYTERAQDHVICIQEEIDYPDVRWSILMYNQPGPIEGK